MLKKMTFAQAENLMLDAYNGHESVISREVRESLEAQQKIADFKSWLHEKMDATMNELVAVGASEPGSIREASLLEQWAKYRNAECIHMEFLEALNAQSTR